MKSILKNRLLWLILSFFFSITNVKANSIDNISMDVYIDNEGNAFITEVWQSNLTEGTEGYRTFTNLGNSKITNFIVSDDSGRVYDSLTNWNPQDNFNNKAYKNGLHSIINGVELCWGISNYGNRVYTLKYNINNFIEQYTDTQGIYFNFLNLDQKVGSAKIKIHSDKAFSLDNAKIWVFGYEGTINFVDGSIVLESKEMIAPDQYMVGLIRFENNIFNTSNKVNKSFDDVYDEAFEKKGKTLTNFQIFLIVIIVTPLLIICNPFIWIIILLIRGRNGYISEQLDFGIEGKILPNDKDINYYREIPCNKDLERAYFVCLQYNVIDEYTLNKGIIGAILLKWIRNGYITVSPTKKGLFNLKDNDYAIDFTKMTQADNEIENSLFRMLVLASGANKILEAKEFLKWSKKNYAQFKSWFSDICIKEQKYLEQQGLITSKIQEGKNKQKTLIKYVNPKLKEEAIQMKGLKKFLLDFSIMPEREYIEVHLWEDYLIFAQLLGIASKVEEQFSKLYPNFKQETLVNSEIDIMVVNRLASDCYDGILAGEVKSSKTHDYSGNDCSSGGGGSSYSSGGSSAGGSSHGGFR